MASRTLLTRLEFDLRCAAKKAAARTILKMSLQAFERDDIPNARSHSRRAGTLMAQIPKEKPTVCCKHCGAECDIKRNIHYDSYMGVRHMFPGKLRCVPCGEPWESITKYEVWM